MLNLFVGCSSLLDTSKLYRLTKTSLAICMQVVAQAAFAAVAQSSIITAMTQNTDLLTPTSVCTAWVCYWRKVRSHKSKSVSNSLLPLGICDLVLHPRAMCMMKTRHLTIRLFQSVYDCHSVGCLRCAVNDFWVVVAVLVGFHHRHPGPVSEVNVVLKQADAKWVRDGCTTVDHCFSD